jgi:hypothetical protein
LEERFDGTLPNFIQSSVLANKQDFLYRALSC